MLFDLNSLSLWRKLDDSVILDSKVAQPRQYIGLEGAVFVSLKLCVHAVHDGSELSHKDIIKRSSRQKRQF